MSRHWKGVMRDGLSTAMSGTTWTGYRSVALDGGETLYISQVGDENNVDKGRICAAFLQKMTAFGILKERATATSLSKSEFVMKEKDQ
jgi:hypothetical protein